MVPILDVHERPLLVAHRRIPINARTQAIRRGRARALDCDGLLHSAGLCHICLDVPDVSIDRVDIGLALGGFGRRAIDAFR